MKMFFFLYPKNLPDYRLDIPDAMRQYTNIALPVVYTQNYSVYLPIEDAG